MKKVLRSCLTVVIFFVIITAFFNVCMSRIKNRSTSARNIAVNRIHDEICGAVSEGNDAGAFIASRMETWQNTFDKTTPDRVWFIPADSFSENDIFVSSGSGGQTICALYDGNVLKGFVGYRYDGDAFSSIETVVNITILLCFLATLGFVLYVRIKILDPFNRLSNYPERIAKLPDAAHLPEDKNRWFGKYIWSMNMLRDILGNERRRNEQLECERQTLIASIAHSVKTPVMNIRLYAEALNNGLTLEDGTKADIKDIAAKIDSNAVRIQKIAAEVINASGDSAGTYEPQIEEFYLKDLHTIIEEEYKQRMELARIPFTVELSDNPLVRSDRYGILRIISLLMDNAVKYGNGKGINITLSNDYEGIMISVRNKGELLPEEELTFIFASFRRGSNSADKEGSGIGLFTAKKIASSLGGSILARRLEESGEMEFCVYIENR